MTPPQLSVKLFVILWVQNSSKSDITFNLDDNTYKSYSKDKQNRIFGECDSKTQ